MPKRRWLINAGTVYIGDPDTSGTPRAATRDENVFEINSTIRAIRLDGSRGPVKGFRRPDYVVATLTVNVVEITEEMRNALQGYIDLVCIVGRTSDPNLPYATKTVSIRLQNCLVEEPLLNQLKFEPHFCPPDLEIEPWSITYS